MFSKTRRPHNAQETVQFLLFRMVDAFGTVEIFGGTIHTSFCKKMT